jgi:hypothetical protein
MKNFNASRVRVGDLIQVLLFVNEQWIKGEKATVMRVEDTLVTVSWHNGAPLSDLRHEEYEILDPPRLSTSERIAIVLLIGGVIFCFVCRAMGLYDN